MATNTTFTPEMGGTGLVYSRLITLNDDRDTVRYWYVGQAHDTMVEDGTGKPVDIDINNVGDNASVVDGADAEEKREVARQAVMALMDNLDDDGLVEELAYLFRYQDGSDTDNLKVDSPQDYGNKLKAVLQELRNATANLDGQTISLGDDIYALIPHT